MRLYFLVLATLTLAGFSFEPIPAVALGLNQQRTFRLISQSGDETSPIVELRFQPWELVTAVAWSPDGKFLAIAAGDTLYLYAAQEWQRLAALHVGAFSPSLAFSPTGEWLVAGSRDGFIRLWRISTLLDGIQTQPTISFLAHRKGVNSVAFSPDGQWLASGGNDAVAKFWNPETLEMLGLMIGGTFAVPAVAFDPDGRKLAVVNGDALRLREVGSGRILGTFRSPAPLFSIAFHPDGSIIAGGDIENTVRLWEVSQPFSSAMPRYPEPIALFKHAGLPGNFRALIWRVVFSPEGQLLASAGGDGFIRLWDVQNRTLWKVMGRHTFGVTCLAFRGDGEILASGGLDGTLKLWDIEHSSR